MWMWKAAFLSVCLCLVACNDDLSPAGNFASTSDVTLLSGEAGPTPFIRTVRLTGWSLVSAASVQYTVLPKPGYVSRPVRASFTMAAARRLGYFEAPNVIRLPVFGLYAGYSNRVLLRIVYQDNSLQDFEVALNADPYADPRGIYDSVSIVKRRSAGTQFGFDYFFLKRRPGSPVVVDTDGEIRWIGPEVASSYVASFTNNGFVIGSESSAEVSRLELDGSMRQWPAISTAFYRFHHNVDAGRDGLIAGVDTLTDIESIVVEFTPEGGVFRTWDFGQIISAQMASRGDDPSAFVRPGVDWFHSNAAAYDSRNNALIVSSRENFLIAIDYDTSEILWILGDPTKHWYSFPSLREKALTLQGSTIHPIGQHSVSVNQNGSIMIFNNGLASLNQPTGAPVGESRTYSSVTVYRIDRAQGTATVLSDFDNGRQVHSRVCSSAYGTRDGSLLVNYAVAQNGSRAKLVGLDASRQIVFDIEYPTSGCNTSWNAMPIPMEDLRFQ